jgi:ubiquinone/menaquinone biosynthesis C-methylase UbiE
MRGPDPQRAVEKYRRRAHGYDASAAATMDVRRRAIDLLALAPGESVLDVACGTGLSFPALVERVGAGGRVVGAEVSPDMMDRARARVAQAAWRNVALVEGPIERASFCPAGAPCFDAVLFHYTHDVLQSPAALRNIVAAMKPGARVALAGIKYPSPWLLPAWLYRLAKARPYVTTFRGLRRPWSGLAPFLAGLDVEPVMLGTNYLARGRLRG